MGDLYAAGELRGECPGDVDREELLQRALERIGHPDFTQQEEPSTQTSRSLGQGMLPEASNLAEDNIEEILSEEDLLKDIPSSASQMMENCQISPPKTIQKLEKIAKLHPSDSDISSVCDESSGSAFSWSASLRSCESSYRDISGKGSAANNSSAQSSVEVVLDHARLNSSKIENMHKGASKRAVRLRRWQSTSQKRLTNLEDSVKTLGDIVKTLNEKVTSWMDQEKIQVPHDQQDLSRNGSSLQISAISWVVPYYDFKGLKSPKCVPFPRLLAVTQDHQLQAKLYLEGFGSGLGRYLSIAFYEVSRAGGLSTRIKVSVVNHEDESETVEKSIPFTFTGTPSDAADDTIDERRVIPKLIPLSSVEDESLRFTVDGHITINISVEIPS